MEFNPPVELLSLSNEELDVRTTEELKWLFEPTDDLFNVNLNQFLKLEGGINNESNPFFTTSVSQFDFQNIQADIAKRSSGKSNWEVENILPNNIGKFRKMTINFSNFQHLCNIKQVEISIKRIGGNGASNIYLDYTEGSTSNQSTVEPLFKDTLLFDISSYSSLPPNDRKITFYIKTNWVKGTCNKPYSHPFFQFNINLLYSQSLEDGTDVLFAYNFRSQELTIKPHKWESKDNKKNGIAKPRKKKGEQKTDNLTGSKRTNRNNKNNGSGKRKKLL